MNVLFVCSRNKIRSVTAERIYSRHPHVAARSAGTADSARHRVSADDIRWADVVFAFEHRHKQQLTARFGDLLDNCRLVVLDIPDEYELMDDELMDEIRAHADLYLQAEEHTASAGIPT